MFVQVVQGRAKDAAALRRQGERWDETVKPGAKGFLGSTAGVTADGEFIALVRFESEEAARENNDRPEQDAWWKETSQYVEDVLFHNCTLVDVINDGGSDDAGFVQVIQGKVTDVERARELDRATEAAMNEMRPDVIGGIVAWHPQNGRFTNAVYFTSEAEARANEQETSTSEEFEKYMREWQALSDGEPKFLDLSDPQYSSP